MYRCLTYPHEHRTRLASLEESNMQSLDEEEWATIARGEIIKYREERGKCVYTVAVQQQLGAERQYLELDYPAVQKYITFETFRQFEANLDLWLVPSAVDRQRKVLAQAARDDVASEKQTRREERAEGKADAIEARRELLSPLENLTSAQRWRDHRADTPTDRAARGSEKAPRHEGE